MSIKEVESQRGNFPQNQIQISNNLNVNKSQSNTLYTDDDYIKEYLHKSKQTRKGYLSNLTKCLNRALAFLEQPENYKEVRLLIEKIEFAILKLQRITEEICGIAPETKKEAMTLLEENKARSENVLSKCRAYMETADHISQCDANSSAIDEFFNDTPYLKESKFRTLSEHKSTNSSSRSTRKSSKGNIKEAEIRALQASEQSQRRLKLLRQRRELEEAEILAEVTEAEEKLKLARMIDQLQEKEINTNTLNTKGLYESSIDNKAKYAVNFKPKDRPIPQRHWNTNNDSSNEYNTPHTPIQSLYQHSHQLQQCESIDRFIDFLEEGKETIIPQNESKITIERLFEWEFETRNLPPVSLIRFDGDPCKWPDFIQNFKVRVHDKHTFNDTMRMERLISVLDGEARRVLLAIGQSGIFYASALKSLKRNFGNPVVVSYMKLKVLLDLPQIPSSDYNGLRAYQQKLKVTVTWLKSMGYIAAINSTENITKGIMRLPNFMRNRFYKDFEGKSINENEYNLQILELWLSKQLDQMYNPFAVIIESEEKKITKRDHKLQPRTNQVKENYQYRTFATNDNFENDLQKNVEVKCWICRGDHKVIECKEIVDKNYKDRIKLVKERKLCFNCLSNTHMIGNCKSKFYCKIEGCFKRHHTLLHPPVTSQLTSTLPPTADVPILNFIENEQPEFKVSSQSSHDKEHVFLQVVPVTLISDSCVIETNALLDSGSDTTLIKKDVAHKLGITGRKQEIKISGAICRAENIDSQLLNLTVTSATRENPVEISAWSVENLDIPIIDYNINDIQSVYPHLSDITFPKVKTQEVALLIGTNHADLLVHRDFRIGNNGDPIAVKTTLGWILVGGNKSKYNVNCNFISSNDMKNLNENVKKFWSIDSYGTLSESESLTPDEKRCYQILKNTTKFTNGHFEVGLLWKEDVPVLPYNRKLAEKRFENLEAKFRKNPEYFEMYKTQIEEYINLGHAKMLTSKQKNVLSNKTNYIPHHGVVNIHKPGRVRVVFDASAKYNSVCLNDKLLSGIDYLSNLVSVLTKFRHGRYAIMGDIEKMFLQVKIKDEDLDSMRFLWRFDEQDEISDYVMVSHLFGKKDSPCIANWSLKQSAKNESKDIQKIISENFYMDDFLYSLSSEEELTSITKYITSVLNAHGFHLTKFVSNSTLVLNSLPSSELSKNAINLDLTSQPIERTLGLVWRVSEDTFSFKPITKSFPTTKRGILSMISSIYDPLGILVPCLLLPKKIIQDLWVKGIDWDEQIPSDLSSMWERWKNELKDIDHVSVDRWFGFHSKQDNRIELHIFCDASTIAYGAVAYLKCVNLTSDKIYSAFVTAKSRLAPLKEKTLTVPRLELQAAVLAVRLKSKIIEQLEFEVAETYLWSDSQIVIKYIQNTNTKFPTFVMNRLNEIHLKSTVGEWKHIPGTKNPADLCTRFTPLVQLTTSSTWIKGPPFLNHIKNVDHKTDTLLEGNDNVDLSVSQTNVTKPINYESFIKWNHYSSFKKLTRQIAALFKLKRIWIAKSQKTDLGSEFLKISVDDLNEAENEIYKEAQRESFPIEYDNLSKNISIPKNSKILSLNPFFSGHLLRVGGRIRTADIPFENKHQIILCKRHHLSNLVVLEKHEANFHCGRDQTLAFIRKTVWITNAKSLIRSVLKNCSYCKRLYVLPKPPFMGDLPNQRIAIGLPPFTNTGIDYFGPLTIKLSKKTRANPATAKRYGAIFTCLTTRCVHIELAGNLSTDNFILAFRRFISRRGYPVQIHSDNGTNFVGAERELREAISELDEAKIKEELTSRRIKWNFSPPVAPWMNGAMEAIVKITKKALKTVVKESLFTEEMLSTYLTEIESLINSRPLTSISDDINDFEALTPNHFLLGRANPNLNISLNENNYTLRIKWKFIQNMLNVFWKRWISEYLPILTTRGKWRTINRNFEVGDLVLLSDKNIARCNWPLGRIIEVFKGSDEIIRVVKVKTSSGIYVRPTANICFLEESK